MNSAAKKYLNKLNYQLSGLPEKERQEILLEIKNHIFETSKHGEDVNQILDRMGSPSKLAKAYYLNYQTEQRQLKPIDLLNSFSFYLSAGVTGTVVLSFFSFLILLFSVVAVIIAGTSITNLIGITHVPMFVWEENSIPPGLLQLLLGNAVGGLFTWLAYLCWTEIKKCIGKISLEYRKFKLNN